MDSIVHHTRTLNCDAWEPFREIQQPPVECSCFPSMGTCWTAACSARGLCRGGTDSCQVCVLNAQSRGLWIPFESLSLRWTPGVRDKRTSLHQRCGELGRRLWTEEQTWSLCQHPQVYQMDQKQDELNMSQRNLDRMKHFALKNRSLFHQW